MNKKTKTDIILLEESIEHWFENLMMLQLNNFSKHNLIGDVFIYGDDCPLCHEYYFDSDCEKCPIAEKVNAIGCRKTHWLKVKNLYVHNLYVLNDNDYEKLFEAITNQLNFLIELKEELANK